MDAYRAAQAAAGLILAVALMGAAFIVRRRRFEEHPPSAARWFAVWWLCLGGAWLTWSLDMWVVDTYGKGSSSGAFADYALILVYFVLILAAFASLFAYLLFLYTGRTHLSWLAAGLYGLLAMAFLVIFIAVNPLSTYVHTGIDAAVFGSYQQVADGLRIALLLPPVIGTLGLLLVPRRIADAVTRRRVIFLSAALFLYLLMPLLFPSNPGSRPSDPEGWAREFANKAGLLLAIATLFFAYRPVGRPVVEEGARRSRAADALAQRVHDLV